MRSGEKACKRVLVAALVRECLIQLISSIRGFSVFKFAYVLKFICNLSINSKCF